MLRHLPTRPLLPTYRAQRFCALTKIDIDPHLVFKPGRVEFTEELTSPGRSHWTTRRVRINI
jgi:hypothetical protein